MSRRRCFLQCDRKFPLYGLPREDEVKNQWLTFIFTTIPEQYSPNLLLCSRHFAEDCFLNRVQFNAGFSRRLLLKDGAVPTMMCKYEESETVPGTSQQDPGAQDFSSITGFHDIGCQTDPPKTVSVSTQAAISPVMDAGNRFCLIMPAAPTPPRKRSVGTQLSMKTLQNHFRSTATQARVPSRDCGVCTLTFPLDSPLLFLQPTTVKRPRLSLTDEEEGPSECSVSLAVNEPEDST
ncbi:uncharacterized protein LOC131969157 [Centropristis striata]|uniref:uncharacterized protein LOC131969157 n=1 Tax=Centropristis striata TaxID=184440 RepID=UPI0027E00255|nr:uncharacterized protein LOC131969157 [Centropristis striata]